MPTLGMSRQRVWRVSEKEMRACAWASKIHPCLFQFSMCAGYAQNW